MENSTYDYQFAIFDIDGTLTRITDEALANNPRLVTPNSLGEQEAIPGVTEKLATLKQAGVKIALATNRGGVAWGFVSLEMTEKIVREAAELCGIPDAPTYFCPYHSKARGPRAIPELAIAHECRKPMPGMLIQAMKESGFRPKDTVYVGDGGADFGAAQAANVQFYWANEYFI